MEPLYETKEDLERESKFRWYIESHFRCKTHRLPLKYSFDIFLSRDGWCIGMGEIKIRSHDSQKFGTLILGSSKLHKYLYYSKAFGGKDNKQLPFLVFVNFSDGCYWAKYDDFDGLMEQPLKATNHPDEKVKMVVHLPIVKFKRF